MATDITSDLEVEGSQVLVFHADESGTDPEYTGLALADKDDLSIPIDEDDEDFNPGATRRTRRYRTNNTVDAEVSSAIATDLSGLEKIGVAVEDENGMAITFKTEDRRIGYGNDEWVGMAYFKDDVLKRLKAGDEIDLLEDSELCHRLDDLELTSPEIDPSETPPQVSWTWWVEGDPIYIDYYPDNGDE
ncbi:hypothetical protein [Natrialba sp. SSL1]|uniref:hypothetical protein n=1 Tax=Natrialba sp. SSL1 TaxID=1869245 RepID=UPI0008F8BBAC|nr:hypothetical protein [Natrialba sp. SSL1]OIB56601.1 hypothetical protein BBD46_16565 [Natrialba sp. SSL1]